MLEQEKLEKMIADIQVQLETEKKTAEIIAENADNVVKSHETKFDAIEKSLNVLLEKIELLSSKVDGLNLNEIINDVEKSISEKVDAAKSQLDEKVEDLAKSTQAQKEELVTLQKAVEVIADEPVVKSVLATAIEPVAENKTEDKETIDQLIKKASEELKNCNNNTRSQELFKAICSLESGIIPNIKLK